MASKTWVSVNGDWATAASWNPAGVPVDGDDIYFTGSSQVSVTAGLTLGVAGDALASLNLHENYTGSIGTSGGKLIALSITTIRHAGRGSQLFVQSASTTNAYMQTASGRTDFAELAGTYTNVYLIGCAGSMAITAAAAITNLDMHGSVDCTLTINASVTALNRIRQSSGRIVSGSAVSTGTAPHILITGGRFEHTTGVITTMNVAGGGLIIHRAPAAGTTLNIFSGGTFDGRTNASVGPLTFTDVFNFSGGKLFIRNALDSYAVTNYYPLGGSTDTEIGAVIAI